MNDRDLLQEYFATVWSVWTSFDAPLRVRPGVTAPAVLSPSAIVTAHNPASQRTDADENLRADEALRARLDALGLRVFRSRAIATDPRWNEPGWCVPGIARDAAVALASDFGQNAIVWIAAAGEVTIVASREGFCGASVGDVLTMPG